MTQATKPRRLLVQTQSAEGCSSRDKRKQFPSKADVHTLSHALVSSFSAEMIEVRIRPKAAWSLLVAIVI